MNIKETKLFIEATDLVDKVPLIQGVHGLGKSDIVRSYAVDKDLHCEILILSLMDVGDLLGIPRTVEVGGTLSTVWAAPQWFNNIIDAAYPTTMQIDDLSSSDSSFMQLVSDASSDGIITREALNAVYCKYTQTPNNALHIVSQELVSYKYSKRSVLFLDEFNRAPQDILSASLQLILDRRLHSHILPVVHGKPTYVVAAINPSDDSYTVNSMDPALLDRFITSTVEPDAKTWLEWARDTDQAQVVRDFIAEHPDRIHYTPADNSTGCTPRSWTSLSKIMKHIDSIPESIHFQLIKGTIGSEVGSQFLSFFNNYFKVVKMDEIEALVDKKAKSTKNPETIAKPIAKLIKDQEVIQKSELAEQLWAKYIKSESATEALPLVSYLYALESETLNGFLVKKKKDEMDNYMRLSTFDNELNNKQLFRKIVTKIATK